MPFGCKVPRTFSLFETLRAPRSSYIIRKAAKSTGALRTKAGDDNSIRSNSCPFEPLALAVTGKGRGGVLQVVIIDESQLFPRPDLGPFVIDPGD